MLTDSLLKNNYEILYDNGKILCFVGYSGLGKSCYELMASHRASELCSIEHVLAQDQSWINDRQFIVISSDVKFKQDCVTKLQKVHFFSLVSKSNYFNPSVKIGQGTWISTFNTFEIGNVVIGDHCCIHTHNTFGHECTIGDYCNIGHWGFYGNCNIGTGTVIGIRVFLTNTDTTSYAPIQIPAYCNIMSESRITKDLAQAGTYCHTRKVNELTSLQHRIL